MKTPHYIAIFLIFVLLAHYAYYYPALPEYMSTHFGARGRPDGWMSKTFFIIFQCAILALVAFAKFGLPRLVNNIGKSFINIPNRDYWLEEGRKKETFEVLDREMGWIFVAVVIFFIAVNQLVYNANLSDPQALSGWFLVLFIGFMAVMAVWIVRFFIIFKLPKN